MVLLKLQEVNDRLAFFENCINDFGYMPFEGELKQMAKRIKRCVTVNGKQYWISANTEQEYADKLIRLLVTEQAPQKSIFKDYAIKWFEVYSKPNIEIVTATTYARQLKKYLIPYFGDMAIEDITTDDVQRFFNGMRGAKATKYKARTVLNMILDNAVEDSLITKNPLKSKRLKINGNASKTTEPYTVEQMCFLVQNIDKIKNAQDRVYLVLQALHPLRLEEVLGLQWRDIDVENMVLHIRRAVTHPTRNRPEIKDTKTAASVRDLGLAETARKYLTGGAADDFVIGGKEPVTYTQVRRMCERIQKDIGFTENITPIRFRTTVLTDVYDKTKDVKQTQLAAGHTTAAMTLKHYIKGRSNLANVAVVIENAYLA